MSQRCTNMFRHFPNNVHKPCPNCPENWPQNVPSLGATADKCYRNPTGIGSRQRLSLAEKDKQLLDDEMETIRKHKENRVPKKYWTSWENVPNKSWTSSDTIPKQSPISSEQVPNVFRKRSEQVSKQVRNNSEKVPWAYLSAFQSITMLFSFVWTTVCPTCSPLAEGI